MEMSFEEWLEIKTAFDKEVLMLRALYKESPFKFWKYPNVGKCSERMRDYLDKTAELQREATFFDSGPIGPHEDGSASRR